MFIDAEYSGNAQSLNRTKEACDHFTFEAGAILFNINELDFVKWVDIF